LRLNKLMGSVYCPRPGASAKYTAFTGRDVLFDKAMMTTRDAR
jgi:hypothetical protein